MKRSDDRILSTHVGSLARSHAVLDAMKARDQNGSVSDEAFEELVTDAVTDVVTSNTALITLMPGMPVGGSAAVLGLLLGSFLVGGAVALRRRK